MLLKDCFFILPFQPNVFFRIINYSSKMRFLNNYPLYIYIITYLGTQVIFNFTIINNAIMSICAYVLT